jgi:WS/DGAT/MGAT family acyltransferase
MWFLTGMPDRRVGMFVRTHHTIADGIAGVATLASFLDGVPDPDALPAEPWAPAPAPAEADLLADNIQRRRDARRRMLTKFVHPMANLRNVATAWPAVHELFAEPTLPPTSLDRLVGPDRTLALVRGSLEEVKVVAHNYDAKVNDVLLTVIAGGLRTLLCSRGESVESVVLRIYVPVSLRHGQYAGARGNSIGQMVVPLPIGVSDPVQRLQQITAETGRRKARTRPSVGGLPARGFAGRAMLKLIERQRVNVESADLPGPPAPLYLAGARVLEVFPLLPLIGRVSLGIGALSYAGQFNIAAVADSASNPDIGIFAGGLRNDLHSLEVKLHSPAAV